MADLASRCIVAERYDNRLTEIGAQGGASFRTMRRWKILRSIDFEVPTSTRLN